jgi:hypothetical protein
MEHKEDQNSQNNRKITPKTDNINLQIPLKMDKKNIDTQKNK